MSPRPARIPRPARWFLRSIGPASVVAVGWLLAQGRFRGFADPRWGEGGAAAGVGVAGRCVAGVRRAMRAPSSARLRIRDDLELGAPLVAAAYMVVGLAGPGGRPRGP